LDGGQAQPRELDQLLALLKSWGQRAGTLVSDGACLGFVGSSEKHLPCACLDGSAIITAHARLDNRDELCDWLGLGVHEQSALSDESLIVRAFERWGEACPERLNGDWALAAWLPAKRRLFLARDHFGNTALYYARIGERVAFASDIRALLSLPWLPHRLNEIRVASLLVGGGADEPTATVYCDISRLPPAHVVTITRGEERLVRYWRVEDTPDSGPTDLSARAALLRATLRTAVRTRLQQGGRTGSMLSGGLDSGAVTAFAAEYLSGQQRRLTAFTSVPAFPTGPTNAGVGCTDEGPSAGDVARTFDAIDHVLVPARTVSPVAGIRRGLAIHREPLIAAANYGWITELMADAQSRGIDVLLTGQVGDFVMAGRTAVHGWRDDLAAGRYRAMLKRFSPEWMLHLRRVEWKPWRLGEAAWRKFSVVNSAFAAETRLAERLRDRRSLSPVERQATSNVGAVWAPLGAAFGLTILDPLQDKRVMEQMFSGPRPPIAGYTDRWLFRQSLIGVLPEPVRLSRSKGRQSADIVARLLSSWDEVEDGLAIAESSPLARRCIDLKYCRVLADSIRSSGASGEERRMAFTLVNGLSAALFLAETWES
jgi:asparagine synthase (glutamine-hydrolysing)